MRHRRTTAASPVLSPVLSLGCLVSLSLFGACATGANSGAGVAYVPTTYDTLPAGGDAVSDAQNAGDSGSLQDSGGSGGTVDAGVQDTAKAVDVGAKVDAGKPPIDAGSAIDTGNASKDSGTVDAGPALSCAGKCGAKYDKNLPCQCNNLCPEYGNCCADFFPACKPELLSCKGRCDEKFDKFLPCQCGWDCSKYDSCCSDFVGQCTSGANLTFLEAGPGECEKASDWVATQQINDGDTFKLKAIHGGEAVRFLVVNTPEIKEKQCYAIDAQKFTLSRIKNSIYPGKGGYHLCLVKDPSQPDKDKYGRLLRYVYYKEANYPKPVQLNARLVRLGYGRVYYPFAEGNKHEKIGLWMQEKARQDKVGGWGVCPDWQE